MKYLTVTTPGYRHLTDRMIQSSGVSGWDIRDMGEDVGDFRTPSFNRLCRSKPAIIRDLLKSGEEVFSLDGDVIFFEPITEIPLHRDADIQGQVDPDSGICCGFCHYRPTFATLTFLDMVIEQCETAGENVNEQLVYNWCLQRIQPQNGIKVAGIASVFSYGLHAYGKTGNTDIWDGQEFEIPDGAKAFHANYTIGIEAKVRLLDYVVKKEQNDKVSDGHPNNPKG